MIKRVLILFLVILVAGILLLAFFMPLHKESTITCNDIEIIINDSAENHYITPDEILQLLQAKKAYPEKQCVDSINTQHLEQILSESPIIKHVECYHTPNGKIRIIIKQRNPIMRIISSTGENYYIDKQGSIMKRFYKAADVPLATGYIDTEYASNELLPLALYLSKHPFWDKQITQIHITNQQEVELSTRVGNHVIFLGKIRHFEEKLKRVMEFYERGLNKIGWNKYSRINVEFDNQIICTKR